MISFDKNKISNIVHSHFFFKQIFSGQTIQACDKDKEKNICFSTSGSLFNYSFVTNQLEKIQPILNGTKTNPQEILSIFFDSYSHLWLGTIREVFFAATTAPKFIPV